ncbi:hypothetical protein [Vibrio gallicus]|uniref:hypothetical protein n=1 Tax=Vibrio gallicus TaxID=190897 RepID=UPI0021C2EBB6|nr:hypothetical protein [Vibrio gallicus]
MFQIHIVALKNAGQDIQLLTIAISKKHWKVLECEQVSRSQFNRRIHTVSHFINRWRTDVALSLRQDNVLHKLKAKPKDVNQWWVRQQIDEVVNTEYAHRTLSCDHVEGIDSLELFIYETQALSEVQSQLGVQADIVGWQVMDLICLCRTYNQVAQHNVEAYIEVEAKRINFVRFRRGIYVRNLPIDKPDLIDEIAHDIRGEGIAHIAIFSPDQQFNINLDGVVLVDVLEIWQALHISIDTHFYSVLATAVSAYQWRKGVR